MLNATLIAQALHFFCAYIFIHTIFLKKAVKIIHEQEESHALVLKNIDRNQKIFQQIQEKKQLRWQLFVGQYQKEKPDIIDYIHSYAIRYDLKQYQLKIDQPGQQFINALEEIIIQQVDYDIR